MPMHKTTFSYLKPSDEQLAQMDALRKAFDDFYRLQLAQLVPEGRYKSLAITALEEAAMWANKGITRDSDGTPRPGATSGKA